MSGQAIDPEVAITRIAVEYIEMPDLKLTARQARRLWNLSSEVCDRALAALVERGFLVQTRAGAFLRRASGARAAVSGVVVRYHANKDSNPATISWTYPLMSLSKCEPVLPRHRLAAINDL